MSVALYMDHHVPRVITQGLRWRGVDVLTAYEDQAQQLPDEALLERAGVLKRVLFTQDKDFLAIAALWQREGRHFSGVIFARQGIAVGWCIETLEYLAKTSQMADFADRLEYL